MSSENKRRKTPQSSLCNFFPTAKRLRSATRRILFDDKTNSPSPTAASTSTSLRTSEISQLTSVRREDAHIFKEVPIEIAYRMFDFMDRKLKLSAYC